jgi:hypothetical protein
MMPTTAVYIQAAGYFVAGADWTFDNIIQKDDAVYDLSAKTVFATIRRWDEQTVQVDTGFEDIVVTPGAGSADTAANGGVAFSLDKAVTALAPTPDEAGSWDYYFVQYYVVEDDFYPQMLRFRVRKAAD